MSFRTIRSLALVIFSMLGGVVAQAQFYHANGDRSIRVEHYYKNNVKYTRFIYTSKYQHIAEYIGREKGYTDAELSSLPRKMDNVDTYTRLTAFVLGDIGVVSTGVVTRDYLKKVDKLKWQLAERFSMIQVYEAGIEEAQFFLARAKENKDVAGIFHYEKREALMTKRFDQSSEVFVALTRELGKNKRLLKNWKYGLASAIAVAIAGGHAFFGKQNREGGLHDAIDVITHQPDSFLLKDEFQVIGLKYLMEISLSVLH